MTTLLIIAHEQCEQLSRHLPTLLSMQGTEYEVVVVDMNSEDGTTDMLTALQEEHQHLHHLSLPVTARDISRERLALHLGMRAATSSRVLVMRPGMEIPGPDWLSSILCRWRPDCHILLIPTKRARTGGMADYFTAGHEAWRNALDRRMAKGHAHYRAGNCVVGLEKEIFLSHSAPAHHLALQTGTLDIFISHESTNYNTILLEEETLFPTEDAVESMLFWKQRKLFDVETRHHLANPALRDFVYLWHVLCTIHRGALPYTLVDFSYYLRWCFTRKKTFIKKHY